MTDKGFSITEQKEIDQPSTAISSHRFTLPISGVKWEPCRACVFACVFAWCGCVRACVCVCVCVCMCVCMRLCVQ
uniref:Uncharacterized protein n=1 Tax=Anguilla anguilla TaxID=7936 RepID=A0A0E9WBT8_ANGAN